MLNRDEFMSLFSKQKTLESTPFSEFIRNASSSEKKRVYTDVLKRAVERQDAVVQRRKEAAAK